MQDLADGTSTVLSLPETLVRNKDASTLAIAESVKSVRNDLAPSSNSSNTDAASDFQQKRNMQDKLQNDNKVTISKSFIQKTARTTQNLSDNLSDFTNLGDTYYDTIKGRVSTSKPSPIKVVSDEEFLLMGALQQTVMDLNMSLASNTMFASDSDVAFDRAKELFINPNLPQGSQINIPKPDTVREVVIQQNDTLERIAQREYNDALRWLDLIVINNLKPPYISDIRADGVKVFGDKILIGNK